MNEAVQDLTWAIDNFKQYARYENKPSGIEDFKEWLNYHNFHHERATFRTNENLFYN